MSDPLDPLLRAPRGGSDGDEPAEALHDAPAGGHDVALPGEDRPEWLLPTLVVAFGALIAWLVIFGQPDDAADSVASGEVTVATVGADEPADSASADATAAPAESGTALDTETAVDAPAETAVDAPSGAGGTGESGAPGEEVAVVDPIADAEAEAAVTTSPGAVAVDLPAPGVIRVGASEFPLLGSCVGLQPLAPNDTATVVSSHVFSPDGEREQVVERWFTAEGIDGVRVDGPGAAGLRQVEVVDATVPGGFAASLERPDGGTVDLAVNPLPEAEQDCSQVVVTNVPGQFAFPYTRVVLAACQEGDPLVDGRVVAILSEGARMLVQANGDDTHTLTLRTADTLLSPQVELVDELGSLVADGELLGYSGLVTDGETSLDLTFDLDAADTRACTPDDV